jgi:hypothetical protein
MRRPLRQSRTCIAVSKRQKRRRKMRNNTSKSKNTNQRPIPVYLTVHYGKKGDKKIYAHSEQAIENAGGKWLSCWKSLAGPIRYRQPENPEEAA